MRYRFRTCQLDTSLREFRADGMPVHLEPQVFDLVRYLIEHRDRVVDREELIESVWDGRIVSDATVSARINAARGAVGDSGATQEVIRTFPRRGFRFVADVEEVEERQPLRHIEVDDAQQVRLCRSSDGTRIAYARSGTGPVLVRAGHWLTHLDHDWHSPIWRPVLDQFGRHFTVVRYDQRGNGLSDWDIESPTIEDFLADLEAVIDAAEVERFTLYATSQGVPTALHYIARHPDRVSRLILHGGFIKGRLVRDEPGAREQAEAYLTLMRHGWGQEGSQFVQAFASLFAPDATPEQIASLVELQKLSTNAQNAVALRRAFDSLDASGTLDAIRIPTLVIHARNDGIHPFGQGREIAASIRGSTFLPLESSNHVLLAHDPVWPEFFGAIRRFALDERP